MNWSNMEKRRSQRSDKYQYLLLETVCSAEMMEAFCNEDSISARLNPFDYNEHLIDLQEQLKVEFWRVVNSQLTKRQRDVITLYAEGYTQMEIAKILNVNQSSITKSLNGNCDYKNKNKGNKDNADKDNRGNNSKVIIYGGSKKKIKKIIDSDEKIKDLLQKIEDCRNEKW